ncbi:MAG TPA: PilZ domain-containing protein [Thermoanaerobaculia bacterium]|nr:PilZ domain-containing protein [Thermoanaerobaculia bacterium]
MQRVIPDYPIPASLAGLPVSIVDLSTVGVRIEHDFPMTGGKVVRLNFAYLAEKFSLQAEVIRCKLHRSAAGDGKVAYNSGLRFSDAQEPSRETLRRLVAALLLRTLERSEVSELSEARYLMSGK